MWGMGMYKSIDLNEVLFHGLDYANGKDRSETSLIKLKYILESGSLYSREKQLEYLKGKTELAEFFAEYNNPVYDWNWNGKEYISLCEKKSKLRPKFNSLSYRHYIQGNDGIGLIFPKSLIASADASRWCLMDSEYQIKDEISLDKAIGVFCGMASGKMIAEELNKAKACGFTKAQFLNEVNNIFYDMQFANYRRIKEMILNYGYDFPIFSTIDGCEVGDLESFIDEFDFEDEAIINL